MSSAILEKIKEATLSLEDFKARYENRLDEIELRLNRENLGSPTGGQAANYRELNQGLRAFFKSGKIESITSIAPQNLLTIGSDPEGGYLIIPQLDQMIGQILRDVSPFRRIARIRPLLTGNEYEEVNSIDAAGATWVGETEARPATSTPDLFKLRVPLAELYAMPEATQRLIDDTNFDIVGWLSEQLGIAFGESEGAAFVTGNGVGRPRGFTTYDTAATVDASRSWEVLQHIATTAAGDFGSPNPSDQLLDVVYSLKSRYKSRAVWLMNSTTAGVIRKFKDADGRYLWTDSLVAGQPPSLLGFPVELVEDLADIAANSLSIAFGDFEAGYTIAERPGLRLLLDPYTNKPNVRVYVYRRIGGGVRDFNAIKLVSFSAT